MSSQPASERPEARRRTPVLIVLALAGCIALLVAGRAVLRGPDAPAGCPRATNIESFGVASLEGGSPGSDLVELAPGRTASLRARVEVQRTSDLAPPANDLCVVLFADTFAYLPDPIGDVPLSGTLLHWSSSSHAYEAEIHLSCDADGFVEGADLERASSASAEVGLYVRPFPGGWSIVSDVPSSDVLRARCQ